MGLGIRPPAVGGGMTGYGPPGLGQGPPLSALSANGMSFASTQQAPPPPQSSGPKLTAFVGSISPGITDNFLTQLLSACGPLRSFKRTPTASGKPGAFGFAEFDEPDAISRALKLLDGLMLPALEKGGGPSKALKLTADAKTKTLLETYNSQKMETDADSDATASSRKRIEELTVALRNGESLSADEGGNNLDYSVPAHLKDLQEADLPENQRGIVLSEIAQFRERAMKKEKDKVDRERTAAGGMARSFGGAQPPSGPAGYNASPQGPKQHAWGSQNGYPSVPQGPQRGWGSGAQAHANKPVGFVRGGDDATGVNNVERDNLAGELDKTDEELEAERRHARERKEESSFRDRERRYEPRERQRIAAIERTLARERVVKDSEDRDRTIMKASLDAWDDEESDELFYLDRPRWRARRSQIVASENAQDTASRNLELREAEHLRQESERFLARQMDDLRSLAEEQRKAGLLLVGEDSGPLRLNMSMGVTESVGSGQVPGSAAGPNDVDSSGSKKRLAAPVFGDIDDEEEEGFGRKRRKGLVKLDFGIADGAEANKERLNKLKEGISRDKDVLFKFKVRWEALSDQLIDTKFEKLTKRKMKDYLGELEDDDLIMFVVEHLKDHKGPTKLIEGLEPVLVEEAEDFTVLLWRQIVFESVAYAEGLETGDI
ncbi:hypothetical protein FRB97_006789, partial [Tulasnella sp. 331]